MFNNYDFQRFFGKFFTHIHAASITLIKSIQKERNKLEVFKNDLNKTYSRENRWLFSDRWIWLKDVIVSIKRSLYVDEDGGKRKIFDSNEWLLFKIYNEITLNNHFAYLFIIYRSSWFWFKTDSTTYQLSLLFPPL